MVAICSPSPTRKSSINSVIDHLAIRGYLLEYEMAIERGAQCSEASSGAHLPRLYVGQTPGHHKCALGQI